jgi:hypothetical protein
VCWLTIAWTVRRLIRVPVGRLLRGSIGPVAQAGRPWHGRLLHWKLVRMSLIVLIAALSILGFVLREEAQAIVFFGSGAAVLALLIGEIRHQLGGARRPQLLPGKLNLPALSALNTARNPARSTLTIGLVATASFVIVAISAFRLETGDAGTGGFALLATSDQAIFHDLNTPQGRQKISGFSSNDERLLEDWRVYSLRVHSGEDASCLNLYRPSQPTVLGVPDAFIDRGGFEWAGSIKGPVENKWELLHAELGTDDNGRPVIPVVIDANTATYSLKVGVGDRFPIRDEVDREWTLEVVGLLKNSVLQGKLLVGEAGFQRLFSETGGYRFFLIERAPGTSNPRAGSGPVDVARRLESVLADNGFDVMDAKDQLADYLAVQNTYLSTFQSLGALGLLLGTIGLAVVQLRSVLERRGELAVMRAAGFRRRRLAWMVVSENAVLLLGGLAVGCTAAAVALLPQWGPQSAGIPWRTLAALLGVIAAVGLVAGWLATRSALRAPIVPALRGD